MIPQFFPQSLCSGSSESAQVMISMSRRGVCRTRRRCERCRHFGRVGVRGGRSRRCGDRRRQTNAAIRASRRWSETDQLNADVGVGQITHSEKQVHTQWCFRPRPAIVGPAPKPRPAPGSARLTSAAGLDARCLVRHFRILRRPRRIRDAVGEVVRETLDEWRDRAWRLVHQLPRIPQF